VKPLWDDVNARARGLASHLLGAERLQDLGKAIGLKDLVTRLEQAGFHLSLDVALLTPPLVEAGLRRDAGRKLFLLARWCGGRREVLQIVFEEEDHRSLRALLRGAVAAVAPEIRLDGLIPTAALPMRALEELARLADVGAIGALLALWNSPYAGVIRRQDPRVTDLFQLEVDLAREFLRRSLAAARRGDHFLQSYTRLVVDLGNLRSALVLASESHEQTPDRCFTTGGERVTLDRYREAATSGGVPEAVRLLAPVFRHATRGSALLRRFDNLADLEDTILTLLMREARSAARLLPLSSAPVLLYALSLRSELRHLQRLVWGLALGAPAPAVPAALALAS
jgi:vacuolar-type H+-ATPase subunit C/Vma6